MCIQVLVHILYYWSLAALARPQAQSPSIFFASNVKKVRYN